MLFYLANPPEGFDGGIAIANPQFIEVENRKFVVGTVPTAPDDWASGLRASVAFDLVAYFLEFIDENEFFAKSREDVPRTRAGSIQ